MAIEAQIEKQYIFVELELEQWMDPFYEKDLTKTQHTDMSETGYAGVYHSFALGANIVPHVAPDISVELFIQAENFNVEDVTRAAIVLNHASSSLKAVIMDVVLWKRDGMVEKIPFKLNVKHDDEKARLTTALISVQQKIPLYFGRIKNELFTVEKELIVSMPEAVQNDLQISLVEFYWDDSGKAVPQVESGTLSEREMTTEGWVIHFDNEKMKEEQIELSLLQINILRNVFDKILQLGNKGRFTGWVAENVMDSNGTGPYGETTTFILTSSEPMHGHEKLHSVIMKYMKSVKGFLCEDGGYPLKYESIPMLRQDGNGYGFVIVNHEFFMKADKLFNKMTNKKINFYSKMLRLNSADEMIVKGDMKK